jgi:hypothetical protein
MHAVLVAALAIAPELAVAQGNQGADAQTSESGSARASARAAQAGANTTAGTTTGSSGPSEPGAPDDGPPPLPSDTLCESYNGATKAACIETVTRPPGAQ